MTVAECLLLKIVAAPRIKATTSGAENDQMQGGVFGAVCRADILLEALP
jgi:hypothetical protein